MAGRFSVQGIFRMVDRMTRPMQRIESRLNRFIRSTRSSFEGVKEVATRLRFAWAAVGAAIAAAAAAAVAALHEVVETGLEFDSAMARAGSRFGLRRGEAQFQALEQAALDASRTSEFTAVQAAQALAELGAAGTNAGDSITSLPYLINTATAAEVELGEASDILTDQLSAFGLVTEDSAQLGRNLARVSDVMARGANSTSQSFEQLTGALGNVAASAHSAGIDIETTTALIGAMADQGEKGERAGTRLDAMLRNLRNPSRQAQRALRRLHIETRNSDGSLRDVIEIVGQFQRALGGMNDAQRDAALGSIFEEQGLRSMNLLLATGSDRLQELRTDLRNAGGSTAEVAAQMRDSAGGDMQALTSALESLKLSVWGLIRGPFRAIVQSITAWVRANQGVIQSGLQTAIQWLVDNMPTIVTWARRIGIAIAILAAPFIAFAAITSAAMLTIPAIIMGILVGIQALWDWLSSLADPVINALRGVWQSISEFFRGYIEFTVGLFVIVGRIAMRFLQPLFDFIGRAAARVRVLWAPIGAFFAGIWARVRSAAGGAWNWIVNKARQIYNRVAAIWRPIGAFFSGLWNGIASSFSNTVGGVLESISGLVNGVRAVGRDAMGQEGDAAGANTGRGARQVVSPQERTAREVSERTTTERAEVTIRDETGRAEVSRRPRREARGRIRLQPSGAM